MEPLLDAMRECERACTGLTLACLNATDILITSPSAQRSIARRVVDCSYVAGALARVLERPASYDRETIVLLTEACERMAIACAEACGGLGAAGALRECALAARLCERACAGLRGSFAPDAVTYQ